MLIDTEVREKLIALQEIDSALKKLTRQRRALQAGVAERQEAAEEYAKQVVIAETELADSTADFKKIVADLQKVYDDKQSNHEKLKRQDIKASDITYINDDIARQERRITELEGLKDTAQQHLEGLRERLITLKEEHEKHETAADTLQQQKDQKLQEIADQRERLITQKDAFDPQDPVVRLYNSYNKDGVSVAFLSGGTCSVCNMAQSPKTVDQVLHTPQVVACEECGRILLR
jgi:predicted  nucleic acid-binding Zn-ribbon protein